MIKRLIRRIVLIVFVPFIVAILPAMIFFFAAMDWLFRDRVETNPVEEAREIFEAIAYAWRL